MNSWLMIYDRCPTEYLPILHSWLALASYQSLGETFNETLEEVTL